MSVILLRTVPMMQPASQPMMLICRSTRVYVLVLIYMRIHHTNVHVSSTVSEEYCLLVGGDIWQGYCRSYTKAEHPRIIHR